MARKRKNNSSYKPQEYFRGVKSSAEDSGKRARHAAPNRAGLREKFIGFFVLAVLMSGALLIGYVDSASITISGPSPYEESSLNARVQSYLDSSILRRLKPFVSSAALLEHVRETHPDVGQTTIEMSPFSPSTEITIALRSPALIWNNQDGSQLVVDVDGVAYAEFDPQFHADLVVEVSDATQPQPALSTTVLSAQTILFIKTLDTAVHEATTIKSHRYELPLGAREIRLKTKDYDVRFSLDRFEQEQALELSQLLKQLKKQKVTPSDYIDLRTEDRAFYR